MPKLGARTPCSRQSRCGLAPTSTGTSATVPKVRGTFASTGRAQRFIRSRSVIRRVMRCSLRPRSIALRNQVRDNGFTLIELLVALVVGAIVLLGAHRILATLADQAHALTRHAADVDQHADGERMLRDLVGQLELGSPGTVPFTGSPDT